jgi:hypothetical protein
VGRNGVRYYERTHYNHVLSAQHPASSDLLSRDTLSYLASCESGFLTGVNLEINGGLFFS